MSAGFQDFVKFEFQAQAVGIGDLTRPEDAGAVRVA